MHIRRAHVISSLLVLLALPCSVFTYDQPYIRKIQHKYLKSFGLPAEKSGPSPLEIKGVIDLIKSIVKPSPFTLPTLSDYECFELVFQAIYSPIQTNSALSEVTVDKMGLVYGAGKRSDKHLISYLSTIADTPLLNTKSGHTAFAQTISQPHTNVATLKQTQAVINALKTDSTVLTNVTTTLQDMGTIEHCFLSYFREIDIVDAELLQNLYWKWPAFNKLNNSSLGLETGVRLNNAATGFLLTMEAWIIAHFARNIKKASEIPAAQLHPDAVDFIHKIGGGMNLSFKQSYTGFLKVIYNNSKTFAVIDLPIMYLKLKALGSANLLKNMANLLQAQLIGAASYVKGAQQLYTLIKKNPDIAANFSNLSELEALVKPSTIHSKEFNELIQLLSTNTFTGEASFFSLTGRVLRAHLLMRNPSVQQEFAEVINAIGELDMYAALAHKMNSTAGKEATYCFVAFDTTSSTPYINATGMWNPFVNENNAITNNITIGGTQPRNLILSGPNTGGKSTLINSIILNTILAQTFGIAAAQSMIITLFGNIDCYKNMTDDTASGVSGLQAEVDRTKEIINRIKEKGITNFNLLLLDEISTATSPDQAAKLALEFVSGLSVQPNCLSVNSTHLKNIVQFAEQSQNCANYQMGAVLDNQGKVLKYTYKIQPGYSTIQNAEQVTQASSATW